MAPSPRRRRLHAAGAATAALLADTYLSLTARPLRTSAMVAGIVLGVASATAAVVVADTQRAQIDKRFDAQRSHFVVLLANGDTSHAFPSRRVSEIAALEPVAAAGELSIWDEGVAVSTSPFARTARVPLIGATASGLAAAEVRTVSGIPVRAVDRLPGRSLVWVGIALARRLGIRMDLPQTASIAARPYTVAGLVRDDAGFGYVDDAVVMASSLARTRYGPGKTVRFLAHVRPGAAGAVAEYARAALDPTGQLRLADATPPDGRILLGHVTSDLRRIGLALGLLVGLIGMVAVANTQSMAVNQRSRELGLRAALGWSRRRIGRLILAESGIAGLLAAILGCGLGLLGAFVWCRLQGWQLIVWPSLGPIVVAAGTLSSLVGGVLPAHRAASISPLEAMRS
jgi:putative ABC transport system permease protein